MRIRSRHWILFSVMLVVSLGAAAGAAAQGLTGQISGTVVDSTTGVLPGATVSVKNAGTGVSRDAVTDATGTFVVTNLLAGTYDVSVTLSGFKPYEKKGVEVSATGRVALPPIALQVGGVSEQVSVQAEALQVQTTSGERSATITADQIQDTGLRGRDFMGTLKVLPGVVDTSVRDAPGWNSVGNMTINGQSSFNFSYDGIVSKDTGSNSGNFAAPGLDSIAEVKLQSSNFQAEYGRSSGASITVITKSGTKNFKGSIAYYKRDERFNANTFDRRRNCDALPVLAGGVPNPSCSKAPYRFDNTAWTIGGPVILPGVNRNHDRLFFFFSQDLLPRKDPGNLSTLTMPTALERQGDFSQTVNSQGNRIWIKDPVLGAQGLSCNVNSGGAGCFTNNIIPSSRINAIGQTMMNLMPLPNAVDPSGTRQYNYTYQNTLDRPRNDQVARVDWNVNPGKTTFYSRLQFGHEVNARGYSAFLGSSGNGGWPQFYTSYEIQTYSTVNTLLHTFSPTTVLEVTVGQNWSEQSTQNVNQQTLDANDRNKVLAGLPQFFPQANPLNLIPNVTFAGTNALPNMPSLSFEQRYPFGGNDITTDITSNLTKVMGHHNTKLGILIEHNARPAARTSNFNGTYSFNASTTNPQDTNFGYANALLGSINTYTESTSHPWAQGRYNQVEFFAQDNWRVSRKFTLDYGVRAYYIGPTFVQGQQVGGFDPTKYSSSGAAVLYQPVCPNNAASCSGTARLAKNPLTGETLPNIYLNKVVPGSGDFYSGLVVYNQTAYKGWWAPPALRGGFAWDVTGDGKTAIRGGYGTFYDRYSDDTILQAIETPPLIDTRQANNTTMTQLLSTPLVTSTRSLGGRAYTGANLTVGNMNVGDTATFHAPTVYNWSLGIQRQLPFSLAVDVAYVGNASRYNGNQGGTVALNGVPYGTTRTDLNPQNADPTNSGQPIDTDYLRPYRTYQGISLQTWAGYANYHSIQLSVQRRFNRGFSWGFSYTGSIRRSLSAFDPYICPNEALTCSNAENAAANKARNYTRNGSRPHNFVINYDYQVPSLSKRLHDNPIIKGVFDGWQLSGVTVIQSGTWNNFGVSFTGAPFNDMTGGPGGSRVVLKCDPILPRAERTYDRQFRTECIAPPGPTSLAGDIYYLGNATNADYLTVGYINHDVTFFKNFFMPRGRMLQFRIETYNLPNQTQYGTVNTNAQFNFATGAQTNTSFGKVTAARASSNRTIQLGVRFVF